MVPSHSSEARIVALDGLRGIAALMVIAWHLTGSMVEREGWTQWIYAGTIFGRTGVDLFFVLSGFLIIGILIDRRGAPNLFKTFYLRRACRILPPYATLILVYWLCYALLGSSVAFNNDGFPLNLVAQGLMLWNAAMAWTETGIARAFSITWSVNIEEHFYLVFPFLIWLCPREKIWCLLVAVGLASWLARAAFFLAYPDLTLAPYVLTPFRLDGLCAGGLLALGYRNGTFRTFAERYRTELLAAALIAVVTVPFTIAIIRNNLACHMYLWGHAYLSLVCVTIIAAVLFNKSRVGILRSPLLRLAGRYSYSLYLFHPLFLSLFFTLAGRPELVTTWQDAALTAGSFLVTVAFCILLFETFEKRFQAFGHRSRYADCASNLDAATYCSLPKPSDAPCSV